MRRGLLLLGLLLLLGCKGERLFTIPEEVIDPLRIEVPPGNNREFSYTDKESAFYYGYTNRYNDKYFQGWTDYNQKLLDEYIIEFNGNSLSREKAQVDVYPHQLVRNYGNIIEKLTLLDHLNLLLIELAGSGSLVIYPLFPPRNDYQVEWDPKSLILFVTNRDWQKLAQRPNLPRWLGVSLSPNGSFSLVGKVPPLAQGKFLPGRLTLKLKGEAKLVFATGENRKVVRGLIERARVSSEGLIKSKRERLSRLLRDSWVSTEDENLNRALGWAKISMDALIMNQDKKGIFAGLPWFNSYWGRDTFISLPGALLVTGDFEEAKEILSSFATYQLKDERDSLFGRIPNRVTVDDVIYNTADGTPWFVRETYEYILYSGDRELARKIYPLVKRSIEGTIRYRIDSNGLLCHDDADTWMDARIEGRVPWSPRGDRACEIQALWFTQLVSGARIAQLAGEDPTLIEEWLDLARRVKENFFTVFIDKKHQTIYDHLNREGSPDLQYRPNQILCLTVPFRGAFPPGSSYSLLNGPLGQIDLDEFARKLVYPQGVGSLWRGDVNFHPYHLHPNYHFDASYHNGIIWTWNSGPVITAFLRANRTYVPYVLFKSTIDQILHQGAVGTISELIDVVPKPVMDSPELSGCFSQAWSLAEYLRNFYQDILGVYPLFQQYGLSLSLSPIIKYFGRTEFIIRTKWGRVLVEYDVRNKKVRLYSDELQRSLPIVVEKRDYLLQPGKILTLPLERVRILERENPSKLAVPEIPAGTKSLQFKDFLEGKLRKAEEGGRSYTGGITFPKKWLFKTGDDPSWSDPKLNDSGWAVIEVPSQWEEAGYPGYDGYAWYRLHLLLKRDLEAEPILVLGGVDDADETYLNGVKIGGLGGFPPDPHTEWSTLREYPIPKGLMKKGENVLAIRVYDMGLGGGLHKGPLGIFTRKDVEKMHEISSQPHHSFNQLPFTNGLCYSNYNCRIHRIDSFGEHIYRNYDKTTKTRNLLKDAHWVITLPDGRGIDLSKLEETEANYLLGTGIVKVVKSSDNLKFTSYYFAPFSRGGKILVMLMKVEGRKKPYISRLTITPKLEFEGAELQSFHQSYLQKDVLWSMAIITQESNRRKTKDEIEGFIDGRLPEEILEAEKSWWEDWHQRERIPKGLSEAERALYLQSTAVLKMGQCREKGRSYGQILASLPPAHYNICWVRDGAYAIAGLARSGHLSEAKDGLEFMLQAKTGSFEKFAFEGKEYGIGFPYQISVCRYYGGGEEETDSNQNGPNIELDGFGLFLWALEEYVNQSNDIDLLRKYWGPISTKIADVLVHSIDETDLIRADSGPWERHLPGKHFSYTSAAAVRGLRAAAHFASIMEDKKREREYLAAEERIKKGIEARLVDKPRGVIKGNLEDKEIDKYLDASAVEVINWVIDPQSPIAESTIKAFDEFLRMKKTKHGYFRILGGDWYDRQEWVMIDLRIASALKRMGHQKEAQKIIDWVVAQSASNYNLIAELYSEETTDYQGATPMCGFGAGAYILALTD